MTVITSKRTATSKAIVLAIAIVLAALLSLTLGAPQALAAELAAGSAAGSGSTELSTSAARPKTSKITSMSFKSNTLTIKWNRVAGVDGYQLVYAQKGYFGGISEAKVLEVTKKRNYKNFFKKCMVKGRTALKGDVLYAKIRTFKISGGKRVYSAWSKVKPYVTRTTWTRTFIAPKSVDAWSPIPIDELSNAKLIEVKNKNSKVAAVSVVDGFSLQVKRPGNATVTFKCLGKKITLKVKVVKWTAPFSSFKVNNRDYTKVVNSWNSWVPNDISDGAMTENVTGKLNIKPAKNWKITSIVVVGDNDKQKKVKNGYTVKRSDWLLMVNLKNAKTKATTTLAVVNAGV